MEKYTIEKLRDKNLIVFEAIMGSRAYGTSLPTSDTDIRGVFIQPIEDILGFGYVEQVADNTNDVVFYEIKRFLQLTSTNNPNILELLNAPEDCILYKDPIFDLVLDQKETFITKQCKNSFAGYAIGQIKKARGYNKKMNWEDKEMVRKGVLDFCYVLLEDKGSMQFKDWLEKYNSHAKVKCTQEDFGLANIDHAHDTYTMYNMLYHKTKAGIVSGPDAADVHLWSIPKETPFAGFLTFNKDGFSSHCKKFKEYTEWLENRNEDRFKMNKNHGKQYDSKNMMHTFRLLNMASEIADGKIIVRRSDEERKILMAIRKGEYDYDKLLEQAEELIIKMDDKFDKCDLPNSVDPDFIDNLLITIRKVRYKI